MTEVLAGIGLALLAFLSTASISRAADDVWTTNGPAIPDTVTEIAVNPFDSNTLFVESKRQLFRTTNGGVTWSLAGLPLERLSFLEVAFDHGKSGTVYVATEYGLFQTSDSGETWKQVDGFQIVDAVATDPQAAGVVYVAAGVFVQRSGDGGVTWERSETPVPFDASGLVVSPSAPRILYYSSYDSDDVYKSIDAARTWFVAGTVGGDGEIDSIAVDPTDAETVYVVGHDQLFKSVDGGATFTLSSAGLTARVTAVAVDPMNPEILYVGTSPAFRDGTAGVFRSEDGGEIWTAANEAISRADVATITIDPIRPDYVYAGIDNDSRFGGVYVSSTGGVGRWVDRSNGLPRAIPRLLGLAVAPDSASTVYAVTYGGVVWVSTSSGESWNRSDDGLSIDDRDLLQNAPIAVAPSDPERVYVGAAGGVHRSMDRGVTWEPALGGLSEYNWSAFLAVDPADENTVYVSTVASAFEVFKTTNGGDAWAPTAAPQGVMEVAVAPDEARTIHGVQGSAHGFRLGRTVDACSPWMFGPPRPSQIGPAALSISNATPETVYAALGTTVYRTRDRGGSWTDLGARPGLADVAADAANPDVVWISSNVSGVARSTDGGETFIERNNGLPALLRVDAIVVSPSEPDNVYAATPEGVYHLRIRDHGPLCPGDCSQDGAVTVEEIVVVINIALGSSASHTCAAADVNEDGIVTVDEIVSAVTRALSGCAL